MSAPNAPKFDKPFTLVTTVFNEISRLDNTIRDIENQTVRPTEVVIVDAGSRDGTQERLERWSRESTIKVVVIVAPKCNVAEGRNIAIEKSSYDLIASTDFGCQYHPLWLESLMTPFNDPKIVCVAGAFEVKEDLIDTLAARADYILQRGYKLVMDEYFVPSSRSIAYYKHVWLKAEKYPEWLTLAADDTIYWYVLKAKQVPTLYVEEPYVYWLRHTTYKGFGKESFRYGLGQGEGKIQFRNFVSTIIETSLRWGLVLTLPVLLVLILLVALGTSVPALVWVGLLPILFLQLTFGMRSYRFAWRSYQMVKNEKYNLEAFWTSLYLTEINRYQHLKGYYQGYYTKDPKKVKGAAELAKILGK